MSKISIKKSMFAVALLLVGCATGTAMHDTIVPEVTAAPGAGQWENRCTEVKWDDVLGQNQNLMPEFGAAGFQLVSLVSAEQKSGFGTQTRIIACFTRKVG